MFKNTLIILLFAFSTTNVFASNKRYIIKGLKGKKGEAAVNAAGGNSSRSLKYHDAIVANLSDNAASRLKAKFPWVTFEKDATVTIHKRPSSPGKGGKKVRKSQEVPMGIIQVKADQAHDYNRGSGVVVCVVDTGIDKNHPDLMDNIIGGENFIVKKGRILSSNWDDDNNHGTHVSGTIAAIDNNEGVIGVAPEASLFAVKVLDRNGSGYTSAVADGVRSCIANNTQIISMSLGTSQPSILIHDAIKDAVATGIIVIAAAGNTGGSVIYPAAHPEVIAVSAIDNDNNLASFSSRGPEIAFTAPGVSVKSTIKGGGYDTFNGTSMATPHVTGVFALHLSALSFGVQADSIGLPYNYEGAGLVNALRTVTEF